MTERRLPGGFISTDLPSAEVDRMESYLVPLTRSVRDLVDAVLRTEVDAGAAGRARAEIEAITRTLRETQRPGPAGVHFNTEGRAWEWGNAAVGPRNAVAPPMALSVDDAGVVHGEAELGAAYEGPPDHVHGGVLALLLDHLMGVTASGMQRPTVTGTLTMRFREPTPLGSVRLRGHIDRRDGIKTFVRAQIEGAAGVTVEADGVFLTPRWARDEAPARAFAAASTQQPSPQPLP